MKVGNTQEAKTAVLIMDGQVGCWDVSYLDEVFGSRLKGVKVVEIHSVLGVLCFPRF